MKEFFGFGGYTREAEGFLSWQHLLFVGSLLTAMVLIAIVLGKQNRLKSNEEKNKVLIWVAILIDSIEIFKIVLLYIRSQSTESILYNLPLFLCSIQLIAIPIAAFSKGRIKEAWRGFKSETKKIVWPTWKQVLKNTGVVLVVVIICAIIIGALDYAFSGGIQALTDLFRS